MDIHIAPRQRGKTTELVKWARDSPKDEARVIVSPTLQANSRLQHEILNEQWDNPGVYFGFEKLESWQFLSLTEVVDARGPLLPHVPKRVRIVLGLDNLDLMLPQLLKIQGPRTRIGRFTLTHDNDTHLLLD